jgi:hypothetical protein
VASSAVAIPSITYTDTTPPIVESGVLKINNVSEIVQKVEIDFGNKIEMIPDISSTTGLKGFRITDREPKATANPEVLTVAAYATWHSNYMSGAALSTAGAGLVVQTAAVAKNYIKFTAPNAQIKSIKESTRNGIVAIDLELGLNDTATGNDALNIVIDNA